MRLEIGTAVLRVLYRIPSAFLLEIRIAELPRIAEEICESGIEIAESHLKRLAICFLQPWLSLLQNIQEVVRIAETYGFASTSICLAPVFQPLVIDIPNSSRSPAEKSNLFFIWMQSISVCLYHT